LLNAVALFYLMFVCAIDAIFLKPILVSRYCWQHTLYHTILYDRGIDVGKKVELVRRFTRGA